MAEGGARYISLQLIVECIWEYLAAGDWFEGGGRGIQVAFCNLPEYLAYFGLACFQPPIYPNHQHPLTHDQHIITTKKQQQQQHNKNNNIKLIDSLFAHQSYSLLPSTTPSTPPSTTPSTTPSTKWTST